MREIIFRGKRKDNREWVYGFYRSYIYRKKKHVWLETIDRTWEIKPETVGQFTGQKDSAGKKIFEGDIVEDTFGNIGVITYSDHFLDWRVVFFKGRQDLLNEQGARIFEWVYPKMMLKVIGTVHDGVEYGDPELLDRE
jgi:uncharacterized phage protein (TIGR01671 family)